MCLMYMVVTFGYWQKISCSIPDEINGILNTTNHPRCNKSLETNQSLTDIITKDLIAVKFASAYKA
jgi:hypothetical protein